MLLLNNCLVLYVFSLFSIHVFKEIFVFLKLFRSFDIGFHDLFDDNATVGFDFLEVFRKIDRSTVVPGVDHILKMFVSKGSLHEDFYL